MSSSVRRAFRFRVYPTARQHVALGRMMAAHAELYNAALQERRDAWRGSGVSVKATGQMAQLSEIRRVRPDHAEWSFTSQQQTLRRLDKSFGAFFRRVKAGENPGYPRFRSASRFDSVDFRHGDGARFTHLSGKHATWTADGLGRERKRGKREARLHLQGVGGLRVWIHRPIPEGAELGQVSIKREGHVSRPRWFVIIPVQAPAEPLPFTGAVVGIDLATGGNGLAWTSDGVRLDNPQSARQAADRLAGAQRRLAGMKRGSSRRRQQVARVARLHGKVARVRADHLHKTAHRLVTDHDFIGVEALQVTNMTRRAKPRPDPDNPGRYLPNGATAKTGLNRSINDVGWGQFLALLHAKAESAGRVVVEVNPANTSRTCHACGNLDPKARSRKVYTCTNPDCRWTGDADINAAINILDRALASAGHPVEQRAGLAQRQTTHVA